MTNPFPKRIGPLCSLQLLLCLPIGRLPFLGLVGLVVKIDKEEEVGAKESATEKSSGFSAGAGPIVGQVGGVSEGKVGVGAEIDDSEIDDELDDLHGGQVLLPPDLGPRGRAEVIIVHENVDCQVEDDRNPGLYFEDR